MSNRFKLNRRKRRTTIGHKSYQARNDRKWAERAAAAAAGFPSRKRFLRHIRRTHKGETKPMFLPTRKVAKMKSVTIYKEETLRKAKREDVKAIAKDLGIKGLSNLKKEHIIGEILAAQSKILEDVS